MIRVRPCWYDALHFQPQVSALGSAPPIEPEHALAAPRQCMDGRAPHDAETADDDIEMGHSLKSVSLTISCFIAGQAAGADQPP